MSTMSPILMSPNVDDDFIAISGESEDNGGATSAAYAHFSGSRFPRPMVSPRFRDKAVSSNTGSAEKAFLFFRRSCFTRLLELILKTCISSNNSNSNRTFMASLLNCGVSQTTTSTDSADPIQATMNSIIASNMISMHQTMQSQNPTSTAGANTQQTLSASTQC